MMTGEDVSFMMTENRRLLRDIEMLRETNAEMEARIVKLKEEIEIWKQEVKLTEKFYLSN